MIDAEKLHPLLLHNQVIPITFCKQRLLLDAQGVLIWPKHDLLVFSDLHLEKGSFLSQFANPLPRFDSADTIKRMDRALKQYACTNVICLGDSFHDGNAISRMQKSDLDALNKLVTSVKKWMWILGNHDPQIPDAIFGERLSLRVIDNIVWAHEPEVLQDHLGASGQVIGHFHPKSSLTLARRKVSGKTFVSSENLLIMPAFGRYTGGLHTDDPAFRTLIPVNQMRTYMIYNRKIFML